MPRAAAFRKPEQSSKRPVRPAGPESMRDPPEQWDKVDEAADASFPAQRSAADHAAGVKKDDAALDEAVKKKFKAWRERQTDE